MNSSLSRHHLDSLYKNFESMGINYIGHGHLDSAGSWHGYFSNKEWEKIYIENQFYLHEPLTNVLLKTTKPVFFCDMASLEDKKEIMKYRSQICNIIKGLSFMTETKKGQNFLSLGFSSNHVNCLEFFLKHKEQISLLFKNLYAKN
jgi:hypothetical protein